MPDAPPPILVTGCARSGTSLVAGIIHLCGAFGGDLQAPTRYNAKGQFENRTIRDHVVKPWLVKHGWDRLGQKPLPEIATVRELATDEAATALHRKVTAIMQREGYRGGPWFYKGAKLCLVWPLWHAAFPDARWVIVRRDDDDIAASCMRTGFMRAYRDRAGWQQWIDHHKTRFGEMRAALPLAVEVWPDRIVRGAIDEARALIDRLGLDWRETAVREFVTPALWKRGAYAEADDGIAVR